MWSNVLDFYKKKVETNIKKEYLIINGPVARGAVWDATQAGVRE